MSITEFCQIYSLPAAGRFIHVVDITCYVKSLNDDQLTHSNIQR